jgi:hypothetical protein
MKCMAARVAEYDTVGDKKDIIHLCKNLGIHTTDEVMCVVQDYYPISRIPVKTQFFIEEIIKEIQGGAE